jgi:hypothetical protein
MVKRSDVGDDLVGGLRRPCPLGAFYGQEAFFKTLKFRFGLDQFGQRTVRGAFRFIILGLLAFTLVFWEALETVADWALLDWGLVARSAADELVPEIQALAAQRTLDRLRPILEARGSTC